MIQSNVYNYINVMDKAADASWLRNEVIANNIANADTPNYKRKDVAFEGELTRALSKMRYKSMDEKVDHLTLGDLKPATYTDHGDYSYRVDGNNVDIDTENVELARNQIKYNALMSSVNQEFSNLKSVMK
ncbi:MAG: flagellar basal body rod protein FlgB [Lachnospiraceae bacterium]|nr:flagellar basal body rod protein FlgB [Lachnospiraceae bacterium]